MFNKSVKPAYCPTSCRPISLLPVVFKLFKQLFFYRLTPPIENNNIILQSNLEFVSDTPPCRVSTTAAPWCSCSQQLHQEVDYISDRMKRKLYTSRFFLDLRAAFNRIWHYELFYKIKNILPDITEKFAY